MAPRSNIRGLLSSIFQAKMRVWFRIIPSSILAFAKICRKNAIQAILILLSQFYPIATQISHLNKRYCIVYVILSILRFEINFDRNDFGILKLTSLHFRQVCISFIQVWYLCNDRKKIGKDVSIAWCNQRRFLQ